MRSTLVRSASLKGDVSTLDRREYDFKSSISTERGGKGSLLRNNYHNHRLNSSNFKVYNDYVSDKDDL